MSTLEFENRHSSDESDGAVMPRGSQVSKLIIGCGNLLRGDDAAGPILIRRMWERGLPSDVHCADAGTGGMDVAFQMRGVPHVILVDACQSNSEPGAIFEVPGREVEQLPPLQGINLHAFRWDHALAFGRWLLKDEYPQEITVYLIEGAEFQIGEKLSPAVDRAIDILVDRLMHLIDRNAIQVEIDDSGYLKLNQADADRFFPENSLVPVWRDEQLYLLPTRGAAAGGLMLKQRNLEGDRCLLISEVFHFRPPVGTFSARWDERYSGLRIILPDGYAADEVPPANCRGEQQTPSGENC
ncbi:MAG TPA: hydrogenase maturation protease [Pirellulaceae bacterium]|nr:hydrogenase maturation protease [Pirellulaceae bacterium]HMO94154.1 hydrogenase maturation protease [Pirellulaceae bacterium]HMP71169.1 hydrogenase maturation protease [Pirellulaceae bacterium]